MSPANPRSRRVRLVAAIFTGAVIVAVVVRWREAGGTSRKGPPVSSFSPAGKPFVETESAPAARRSGGTDNEDGIELAFTQLATAKNAEESRAILRELRDRLGALPPESAIRIVTTFFASQQDAGTQLDFTLAQGGKLADAPTLRVFLLDYLGQIDAQAARELAVQVLGTKSSPDEWAVSLRNYAWADPSAESHAFLRERTRELIRNDAWREKPSVGYLEAFDVIVHTQDFDLVPDLAKLARDRDSRGVAYAAYLTLDRLTLAAPARALAPLVDRPELMTGREKTRANFVARADVRDPEQAMIVERYLIDEGRTAEELETFSGIFPNANYMVSNNLLTPTVTLSRNELMQRDQASLTKVGEWLNDPRFERLRPHLTIIQDRLRTFVSQTSTP